MQHPITKFKTITGEQQASLYDQTSRNLDQSQLDTIKTKEP